MNSKDKSVKISQSDYQRLKTAATAPLTLEQRVKLIKDSDLKRRQSSENAALKSINKDSKIKNEVFGEDIRRKQYILQRSYQLTIEQDDRIKEANRIILAAKCRAIRNLQIKEKELIEKTIKEHEKQLENIMEQKRQENILIEKQKQNENIKKKHKYIEDIKQQIKENEIQRILEAEKIEQEKQILNSTLIKNEKDDKEKQQLKQEIKAREREEFKKMNNEIKEFKLKQDEKERIADLKIQEYLRQKIEQEESMEKQKALTRFIKEKQIKQSMLLQEKNQQIQSVLEDIKVLRLQEEKEREWRNKEKQAILNKQKSIEDIQKIRVKQIEDQRYSQAVALAKDEEELNRVMKIQQELYEKELEKLHRRKLQMIENRNELLKQINEKENTRIKQHENSYKEDQVEKLKHDLNDKNVEKYLIEKIEKLKDSGMPSKYIQDIEKQLKIIRNK